MKLYADSEAKNAQPTAQEINSLDARARVNAIKEHFAEVADGAPFDVDRVAYCGENVDVLLLFCVAAFAETIAAERKRTADILRLIALNIDDDDPVAALHNALVDVASALNAVKHL